MCLTHVPDHQAIVAMLWCLSCKHVTDLHEIENLCGKGVMVGLELGELNEHLSMQVKTFKQQHARGQS